MPTTKKQRSCKIVKEDGLTILVITETKGRKKTTSFYRVERNSNTASSWRLHKMVHSDEEPVVYDILIDGDNSTCDCIGGEQHGHCKHVESLSALIDAKKL